MRFPLFFRALALCLAAGPALADPQIDAALDQVILPAVREFESRARALEGEAAADCRAETLRPAYALARAAWAQIGDFRIGPLEQAGLTIAFWPDERASGMRALRARLNDPEPVVVPLLPASARGFAGLDLLFGDPELAYGAESPACRLVQALAADLATQAVELLEAWEAEAPAFRDPASRANPSYFDATDVRRALYTQVLAALELTRDARIGRVIGEEGRPRPARAESWRSGQSLPIVLGAARAAFSLGEALASAPLSESPAALAAVEAAGRTIADPGFQDITDPEALIRLRRLQGAIGWLHDALEAELSRQLGFTAGFNASDGD